MTKGRGRPGQRGESRVSARAVRSDREQEALPRRPADFEKRRALGTMLLFPVSLLYYELVFRLFTTGNVFQRSTLVTVLFCFVYGGFGYLLCTLFKNRRWNYIVGAALLLLTALPYGVEAFLYWSFKVFYNLNAIFHGAGDVATGFGRDVLKMIFSLGGLARIVLFLLPTALYLLAGAAPAPIPMRERANVLAKMAAFYTLCIIFIHMSPSMTLLYGDRYNFQKAVEGFGLATGIQLDAREGMLGRTTFTEAVEFPVVEGEASEEPAPASEEPVVYEPNELFLPLNDPNATGRIKELNDYVATLTPSMKNKYTGLFEGKNLIMITAEAFTTEVIDPVRTPTLYRMATKGVQFTDFYQFASAGTTGGEYQHIFGLIPAWGLDSMTGMTNHSYNMSIANMLTAKGYYGMAYHNNDYQYYDRHITHNRLGYSHGYMGYGNGMEQYVEGTWPESDLEMFQGTLPNYIDKRPFNIYYMTVSGHSTYSYDSDAMARKHWDAVEDLDHSDAVKAYLAANMELEDSMTYLIGELEAHGIADDTVICMTGDHYPYGLDFDEDAGYVEELYGYPVDTVFERDHNTWILWSGCLEKMDPIVIDAPTFSLDILPTLCNLFGLDFDSRLYPGRDVFSDAMPLVFTISNDWKTEYGRYYSWEDKFTPADPDQPLPANYVENISNIVQNKIQFSSGVLHEDYFGYLFLKEHAVG